MAALPVVHQFAGIPLGVAALGATWFNQARHQHKRFAGYIPAALFAVVEQGALCFVPVAFTAPF